MLLAEQLLPSCTYNCKEMVKAEQFIITVFEAKARFKA
jgi:hypothetical protein